jgi:hypothetical protein
MLDSYLGSLFAGALSFLRVSSIVHREVPALSIKGTNLTIRNSNYTQDPILRQVAGLPFCKKIAKWEPAKWQSLKSMGFSRSFPTDNCSNDCGKIIGSIFKLNISQN